MKKILIASLLAMSFVTSSYALQKPEVSPLDRRVEFVNYDENEVYSIHAVNGLISTVIFAPGEEVLSYGSGFSTAWEFASRGNHFFLKPKGKQGTTNLVVVTNKRTYMFEVRLGWNRKTATYRLTFRYPQDAIAQAQAEAEQNKVNALLNQNELSKDSSDVSSKAKNFHYTMNFGSDSSSKVIAPSEAFDDGQFTYLKFAQAVDFPAVYRVIDDDNEGLLNSHVEGDYLVIHGIYDRLRLRAGLAVVGLYNEAFTGNGTPSESGVTVQGLKRVIKGE